MTCFTNMISAHVVFGGVFVFSLVYFSRFGGVLNNLKTIVPLELVGYEMIVANSALWASLAFYHLTSNKREWNNY